MIIINNILIFSLPYYFQSIFLINEWILFIYFEVVSLVFKNRKLIFKSNEKEVKL